MIAPSLLHLPMLPLASAQRLIPAVPKKLIRNLTDREIILLTGSRDPRLYTLLNCMELSLLHMLSLTDTNFSVGKLMCRGLLARVEHRCEAEIIGTKSDMKVMAGLITHDEAIGPQLHTFFRPVEEIGAAIKLWIDSGFFSARVIAIDAIIEGVLALHLNSTN